MCFILSSLRTLEWDLGSPLGTTDKVLKCDELSTDWILVGYIADLVFLESLGQDVRWIVFIR